MIHENWQIIPLTYSILTIGNIAHSLAKGKRKEKLLKSMPLIHLCESSFKRIKDENDKVVSNAIRTIGHLFHLLYNSHDIIKIRPDDSLLYIQFCGTVAEGEHSVLVDVF